MHFLMLISSQQSMAYIPIRTFFLLLTVFILMQIPPTTPRNIPTASDGDAVMLQRFEEWIAEFKRHYKNEAEKAARFKIFKSNVEFIESFNRNGTHKFKLGINHYTDLTIEEFNGMSGDTEEEPSEATIGTRFRYENETDVPASVDWVSGGAVTGARAQGECGACWAFAAVSAVESINKIKLDKIRDLSPQQLLDCIDDDGCKGANAFIAFNYVITNKGLSTDEEYPYVEKDTGVCQTDKADRPWATITGYERVPAYDEDDLMRAVANQPVYASIFTGKPEFAFFSGDGVYVGDCGKTRRHAVLVVGYGTEEDGTKYWLIKNSWGYKWGNNGFGKLERDAGVGDQGACSIAMRPIFPTLDPHSV